MKRILVLTAALAVWSSAALAQAAVHVEGAFTQEIYTTNGDGPVIDIVPLPFSVNLDLIVDPNAAVQAFIRPGEVVGWQYHAFQDTRSSQYGAPHPYGQLALDKLQQRLGMSFSESVYASAQDAEYSLRSYTQSRRVAVENGADFTQWDVWIEQTWRADGLPDEPTMSEAWQTRFNLTLQRPAQYTAGQTTSPMTQADLATFLDGFHEAGGEVSLTSHAYAMRGVTGRNEASDEWTATLGGDFVLASVSPTPVPEPGTYALMLVGLVGLGCVARRNRNVTSTGANDVARTATDHHTCGSSSFRHRRQRRLLH